MPMSALRPALHPGNFCGLEFIQKSYQATIPGQVSFEGAMEPDYWKHVAQSLRAGDVVELMAEDGSWEASCRVMYVMRGEVKLSKRWFCQHEVQKFECDTHRVEFKGPVRKWTVYRADNDEIVKDKFVSEAAAYGFLKGHLANIAA